MKHLLIFPTCWGFSLLSISLQIFYLVSRSANNLPLPQTSQSLPSTGQSRDYIFLTSMGPKTVRIINTQKKTPVPRRYPGAIPWLEWIHRCPTQILTAPSTSWEKEERGVTLPGPWANSLLLAWRLVFVYTPKVTGQHFKTMFRVDIKNSKPGKFGPEIYNSFEITLFKMTSRDRLIQGWWMDSLIPRSVFPFICWVYMFYWRNNVSMAVYILNFSQSFSFCIRHAKQESLGPHRRQGKTEERWC